MVFGEVGYVLGQILSIVAVVLGFVSFQMKTPKGILTFQIATALVFSVHYMLIGAMTATALNFLGAVKCVCYYIRNKRSHKSMFEPVLFTTLVIFTSLLTWDEWYSIFIMLGLVVNSIAFSLSNAQTIRKLNLFKSPLCLVYNIIVLSSGGIIYETATLISSVIGIIKNRKADN